MVWEEVDNDYRVGTIRGGNGRGDTHSHTLEESVGQGRSRREAEKSGWVE